MTTKTNLEIGFVDHQAVKQKNRLNDTMIVSLHLSLYLVQILVTPHSPTQGLGLASRLGRGVQNAS